MIFFYSGGYGAGIILVEINLYKFESRQSHLRLAEDKAEDVPADQVRDLWLLCMSRKPTRKPKTEPIGKESMSESSSSSDSSDENPVKSENVRIKGDELLTDEIFQ